MNQLLCELSVIEQEFSNFSLEQNITYPHYVLLQFMALQELWFQSYVLVICVSGDSGLGRMEMYGKKLLQVVVLCKSADLVFHRPYVSKDIDGHQSSHCWCLPFPTPYISSVSPISGNANPKASICKLPRTSWGLSSPPPMDGGN